MLPWAHSAHALSWRLRAQPCGRKLRCGNHLCPSPCHAGPCQPCPLTATIACACGSTSYSTPCGTEASAKPPKCTLVRAHSRMPTHISPSSSQSRRQESWKNFCASQRPPWRMAMQDCPVPRKCAHADDLPPHPCHFGPCPSCTRSCGMVQVSSALPISPQHWFYLRELVILVVLCSKPSISARPSLHVQGEESLYAMWRCCAGVWPCLPGRMSSSKALPCARVHSAPTSDGTRYPADQSQEGCSSRTTPSCTGVYLPNAYPGRSQLHMPANCYPAHALLQSAIHTGMKRAVHSYSKEWCRL